VPTRPVQQLGRAGAGRPLLRKGMAPC